MTRDEVIKGLECHKRAMYGEIDEHGFACNSCPYKDMDTTCHPRTEGRLINDALTLLKDEPKRGRWTTHRTLQHDGEWYCSECGYEPTVFEATPYCPNCSAIMGVDA